MFCKNCGQMVDEGKAFCTSCGAPLQSIGNGPGPGTPQGPVPAPGYQPSLPAYTPPRRGGGRTPLLAGIVVAAVVVLAGIGVGVYFGFFHDRGSATVTGKPSSSTVATVANSSTSTSAVVATGTATSTVGTTAVTSGGALGTTAGSSSTVQTIPSLNPSTSVATTVTTNTVDVYLTATDKLISELEADDARIPDLATQINSTAPKVPRAVRDELQKMLDMLDADTEELASLGVPAGFEESYHWLDEAINHMGNRIYATIQGIDVMAQTGKVSLANSYFDDGRTERDAYRAAMTEYHNVVPID